MLDPLLTRTALAAPKVRLTGIASKFLDRTLVQC